VSPTIGAMLASCDLVITNAYLITMDPRRSVHRHGAVAIDGRDIVMVGPVTAYLLARAGGDGDPLLAEDFLEMATLGARELCT
jgi:hypothetical protein